MHVSRAGCRLFWSATLACAAASVVPTMGQATCPAVLAGLMPRGAANVVGRYNRAGAPGAGVGIGWATAGLPFSNPCAKTEKFPAHTTIDIKRHEGNGRKSFRGQIDSVERQLIHNDRQEYEKGPGAPVTLETVAVGTLLYHDWYTDCFGAAFPAVQLTAVAHNEGTGITIRIRDIMTAPAAKAAALEVHVKFSTADMSLLAGEK
jgi:hypothetical protein